MNWRSICALAVCGLLAVAVGCTPQAGDAGSGNGAGGKGGKRFVFLTNGDDPFWDTCNAGWQEAAKELKLEEAGIVADFQKNNGKPEGQIDRLRQYQTESDIVGVAISVIQADNVGIAREMKKLRDKGVVVITVDGDINREKYRDSRSYYIGTDNVIGGRTLGIATKAILEAKGHTKGGYVQFAGFRDNDNARSRMNGFKETMGEAYTEIDRMPDEMKRDKARDNVRVAIDNFGNKDLVALVGIWAYNAPAIADVVTERKVRDKYTVSAFDAAQQTIAEMGKGNVDVMVVQNPFDMGYQAVRLLKAMTTDDEATLKEMFPKTEGDDADIYTTGLRVVVPDGDSAVKADMFDASKVEFMDLSSFKAWLDQYGLKSS